MNTYEVHLGSGEVVEVEADKYLSPRAYLWDTDNYWRFYRVQPCVWHGPSRLARLFGAKPKPVTREVARFPALNVLYVKQK